MKNLDFEKFLYIHKGLQPVTVNGHLKTIERITRNLGEIDKESADNFILSLYQSKYSWSYKVSQAKALEYWFEFNGESIRYARQRKPKPIIKTTLSEAEITRLLFCCKNIREKAIIAVLAYSGLRPKELSNLKYGDIDFGSNEIRVIQGKGCKDGVIYVSASCIRILLEYIQSFPKQPDDLMFKTFDGLRPFKTSCQNKLVSVLAKRAHINKRVYPYLLRHSLATSMFNRGADILTVKSQLRHAWLETTELYIHSLGYSPKNKYEQFVPSYI